MGVQEVALVIPIEAGEEVRGCVAAEAPTGLSYQYFPYQDETAPALDAASEFVGDSPCIVHPPDGLLGRPLTGFVELIGEESPDMVVLMNRRPGDVGSIELATRRLLRMAGKSSPEEVGLALTGICVFGAGGLRSAREVGWRPERESDLVTVAQSLVGDGGTLSVEYVESWHRSTGRPGDLLEVNRVALEALQPLVDVVPGERNRVEGPVVVHPSACVESSVIIGPTIIGPSALIVESYIGPYTSIGAHVHIEGAEVERSIILAGASIVHVGGRLVASVVGRDARVARDFSLPRALRLNVGDGGEVVLC